MARTSRHASPGLRTLYDRYIGNHPERLASLEEEREKAKIARQIYDLRTSAGLTQAQLAERMGTTASVICRLEDTDYTGPSLSTLRKLARALGYRIEVEFVRDDGD